MKKTWKSSLAVLLALIPFSALFTACEISEQAQYAASGENMVMIVLGADANSEYMWQYAASPEGVVTEGSVDEYFLEKVQKEIAERGEELKEDEVILPDTVPPGSVCYVFKGVKAGEVELTFSYVNPDDKEAKEQEPVTFNIKVYPDKTLEIVSCSDSVYLQ